MATKAQRHAELVKQVDEGLPALDIGQFENIKEHPSRTCTPDQVLRAGEAIIKGATLADADILVGLARGRIRSYQRDGRQADRGQRRPLGPFEAAAYYTIERALAIRRMRWQALAEIGGRGTQAALWMLERRGGKEFQPPTQRHEVHRESREVVAHVSLDAAIDATAQDLGLSADELRAQGDYWARAITHQKRGWALPKPPPQLPPKELTKEERLIAPLRDDDHERD